MWQLLLCEPQHEGTVGGGEIRSLEGVEDAGAKEDKGKV